MKTIYVKYKVLINGLNIVGPYEIDNFSLKTGVVDKNIFNMNNEHTKIGIRLNTNIYLISCLTDYNKLTYNYFESNDYIEIEVANNISKNNINVILQKYKNITDNILDLEKKLRIIFNIPILFQTINIEVYDETKKYIKVFILNKPISNWNRLTYKISEQEFSNNSRFKFDYKMMKNMDNNNFKRAIELYVDSFDSEKIQIRYILIFSSLEAIFNLDSEEIIEKLSRYSAKLLSEDDEIEYKKIYDDIKKLYNKRSKYIHGFRLDSIEEADEKLLRYYARKIIIAYWMIILSKKMTASQILKYLDSTKKMDIQIRMAISSIKANSFTEQQEKIIKIVEDELGCNIPEETKKYLLGNCDK